MPNRPLLVFPYPTRADRSTRPPGRKPEFHLPPHRRQGLRLAPKFEELNEAFSAQQVAFQADPSGAPPEQVVVFETIGPVERFMTAVRHTPGMSWLADWGDDQISPDRDFFDAERRDARLSGRLYLVMVNQQAIDQLISLWKRYKRDPNVQFDRGQTAWKQLFTQLHDVRRWSHKDRLEETGVLQEWRELIDNAVDPIRFEAELWCRQTENEQTRAFNGFNRVVAGVGGRCIVQACIPTIAYHGVLVEAPATAIRPVLESETTRLVTADEVMFFRPVGQSAFPHPEQLESVTLPSRNEMPRPQGDPVVALLDGLPVENHDLLVGRLTVDDPDGWALSYPVNERHHGTGMASLIVHGELDKSEPPMGTPLYVRPVMKPNPLSWKRPREECIPSETLKIDLIHRAVQRIVSGDAQQPPAAGSVRVINLSIGDLAQPFSRYLSAFARLLDLLAYKHKLLFVVSAGNQFDPIELDIDESNFDRLTPDQRQATIWKAVKASERHRTLLSPAESINSLTVGALHADSSVVSTTVGLDPCVNGSIPTPYSRLGPGFRRAIKPDLLVAGGRQLYRKSPGAGSRRVILACLMAPKPPGHLVAAPGQRPGDTSACYYSRGTSNAAALTSRSASLIYNSLRSLRNEPNGQLLDESYFSVLIKTLLVHGARWGDCRNALEPALRDGSDERSFRSYIARYLGYGVPEFPRVISCTDQQATIIGCGSLTDGTADLYRIPLPPSLSGNHILRRLVVTLTWLSPINPRDQKYRKAQLWFQPAAVKQPLAVEEKEGWWQDVQRGTVQHVVMEGEVATVFADGHQLTLKVNCRADAGKLEESVPYGLAVTLEVAEGVALPIYDEIRSRLLAAVRITPSP